MSYNICNQFRFAILTFILLTDTHLISNSFHYNNSENLMLSSSLFFLKSYAKILVLFLFFLQGFRYDR